MSITIAEIARQNTMTIAEIVKQNNCITTPDQRRLSLSEDILLRRIAEDNRKMREEIFIKLILQ